MIVIGIDAHKRTHTMVAIDHRGRKLGEKTVDATTAGHLAAMRWAHTNFGTDVVWAVEDVRAMTARLERDLMTAGGQRVIRVPTKLMAGTRKSARTFGKSDPIDALAVARAALQEPDLPVATHDPLSRELRLLADRRDDLVHYRTGMIQRLLWRVHELDPTHRLRRGALIWRTQQDALAQWLDNQPGLVAEIARDELADIIAVTPTINALERRLAATIRETAPSLIALYGCSTLMAARIIGEAADLNRFKSEAAFAAYCGLAPSPHWSGSGPRRLRSYKSGNRALNAALHQIGMIQIKKGGPAEPYYRRRRDDEHDTHGAAMQRVKRRIARTVYARLHADRKNAPSATPVTDSTGDGVQAGVQRRAAPRTDTHAPPTRSTVTSPRPVGEHVGIDELVAINDRWAAALGL